MTQLSRARLGIPKFHIQSLTASPVTNGFWARRNVLCQTAYSTNCGIVQCSKRLQIRTLSVQIPLQLLGHWVLRCPGTSGKVRASLDWTTGRLLEQGRQDGWEKAGQGKGGGEMVQRRRNNRVGRLWEGVDVATMVCDGSYPLWQQPLVPFLSFKLLQQNHWRRSKETHWEVGGLQVDKEG